eukprot:02453.XXX_24188_23845_1 [CDS] Oithona nana genome sequencing.
MKLSKAVASRPLPYPYTLGAQIMQFPYKFHFQNSWWVKCLVAGALINIPFFWKIQNASMAGEAPKDKGH